MGFPVPTDVSVWEQCKDDAKEGRQVLLQLVIDAIRKPSDLLGADSKTQDRMFQQHNLSAVWTAEGKLLSDIIYERVFESYTSGFRQWGKYRRSDQRLPIMRISNSITVRHILNWLDEPLLYPLRDTYSPFIAFPDVDENFGFLSTHFLNRTTAWHLSLASHMPKDRVYVPKNGQYEEIQAFLNHPKLIMLVINQHTNISDSKVISLPLGVPKGSAEFLVPIAHGIIKGQTTSGSKHQSIVKSMLLLSAGASDFGPRPAILHCVQSKMKHQLHILEPDTGQREYTLSLMRARAVLCMPGLGYDTYRVFETLASGGMPVLERSVGLDRSWYRLPVLQLDDFADVTPAGNPNHPTLCLSAYPYVNHSYLMLTALTLTQP